VGAVSPAYTRQPCAPALRRHARRHGSRSSPYLHIVGQGDQRNRQGEGRLRTRLPWSRVRWKCRARLRPLVASAAIPWKARRSRMPRASRVDPSSGSCLTRSAARWPLRCARVTRVWSQRMTLVVPLRLPGRRPCLFSEGVPAVAARVAPGYPLASSQCSITTSGLKHDVYIVVTRQARLARRDPAIIA
jgi:hypothetical protein